MSPTPVLYMAGIRTIEDVQRVTKLDTLAARTILLRMSEYNGREFTEEEHRICKKFEGFIARERKRKLRSKLRRSGRLWQLEPLHRPCWSLCCLPLSAIWTGSKRLLHL